MYPQCTFKIEYDKKFVNNTKEYAIAMCAFADGLNFKYNDLKMFLLKLGSELQNFIKKFQSVLKI